MLFHLDPQAGFFQAYGWLAKKLRLLFGLSEKHWKRTFRLKNFASCEIYS